MSIHNESTSFIVHGADILGIQAIPIELEVSSTSITPTDNDTSEQNNAYITLCDKPGRDLAEGVKSTGRIVKAVESEHYPISHNIRVGMYADQRGMDTVGGGIEVMQKISTGLDLPIAVAILACEDRIPVEVLNAIMFHGYVRSIGQIAHAPGGLLVAEAAKRTHKKRLIISSDDAAEAAVFPQNELEVIPIQSIGGLIEVMHNLSSVKGINQTETSRNYEQSQTNDFMYIKGQAYAKKALEIAAAGRHDVLMIGPPGGGKSLMAKALSTILPDLSLEDAMEVMRIRSVAGVIDQKHPLSVSPPFRETNNNASLESIIGGGRPRPIPGDVTLAHRGVLFLDEINDYGVKLDKIKQILEDRRVTLSRTQYHQEYPAKFQLIAAMNPCPCGNHGFGACHCSEGAINRHNRALTGPVVDRIAIQVPVPAVTYNQLTDTTLAESSTLIRARVQQAREIQQDRYIDLPHIKTNADLTPAEINRFCQIDQTTQQFFRHVMDQSLLSARSYNHVLRVARTIADLRGSEVITLKDATEAFHLRTRATPQV